MNRLTAFIIGLALIPVLIIVAILVVIIALILPIVCLVCPDVIKI